MAETLRGVVVKWPEEGWFDGLSDGLVLACGLCNRRPEIDYTVDDEVWAEVDDEYRRGVLCLVCLCRLIGEGKTVRGLVKIQVPLLTATIVFESIGLLAEGSE
jgi:hypothetical protein